MSTNEADRKNLKIEPDTHRKLSDLAQSTGMAMSVIVGYLVDLCDRYRMLEPDWIDKLKDQTFVELKQSLSDDKLERALTIERTRAVTRAKLTAWTKYIDCLPVEDRRKYLEQLLGSGGLVPSGTDFLETLSQWSLVKVNGEGRMIRTNQDGTLSLDSSLIPCNVGYHVPNSYCKGSCWQSCEIKSNERKQAKLIFNDPQSREERDRAFLASKGIKVDRV